MNFVLFVRSGDKKSCKGHLIDIVFAESNKFLNQIFSLSDSRHNYWYDVSLELPLILPVVVNLLEFWKNK